MVTQPADMASQKWEASGHEKQDTASILIMLLGLAIASPTTQMVVIRTVSLDATINLAYLASAVLAVGFIIGLLGFFRRS